MKKNKDKGYSTKQRQNAPERHHMPAPVFNHKGYGLRRDEEPYADKIPPGGNWRNLSEEDARAFMKGSYKNGGGNTTYLRRLQWTEPSLTIISSMFAKATCYLHPGTLEDSQLESEKPLLDGLLPIKEAHPFKAVSLFSGGGLLDLGALYAGVNIIWATDIEKSACVAYRHNFVHEIVQGDINDPEIRAQVPDCDIILGGPPCQDFSVAGGGAGEAGARGALVWSYLAVIEDKLPRAFLFENVKGLTTKKHIVTFQKLLAKFDEIGYDVAWKVLNAWDYGVAQKRERVFIVGIRKDYEFTYEFPQSEYSLTGYHPVLKDAIGYLPEPNTVNNHDPKQLSDKALDYLSRDPRHLKKHRPVTMEEPSATLPSVLYKGIPYGLMYPDNHVGGHAGNVYKGHPASVSSEPARTLVSGHGTKNQYAPDNHADDLFDNVGNNPTWEHANRVADWDKPSPTRTEKDRCDSIHPVRPRRFTVRECLRLQSVPDSYVFPDSMSLSAMYRVTGNGVPSRMAYHLVRATIEQLQGHTSFLD